MHITLEPLPWGTQGASIWDLDANSGYILSQLIEYLK